MVGVRQADAGRKTSGRGLSSMYGSGDAAWNFSLISNQAV